MDSSNTYGLGAKELHRNTSGNGNEHQSITKHVNQWNSRICRFGGSCNQQRLLKMLINWGSKQCAKAMRSSSCFKAKGSNN